MASCVRSAPWDMAWRTTHGDYYPSWRRPACGASPLQIGPTWPSSSPQPSKHPFPPPIITVNHSDSSVHGLSQSSGHSALSAQCARCQCTDKHQWLSSGVQSVGSAPTAHINTDTHPFAKKSCESNHKTKL